MPTVAQDLTQLRLLADKIKADPETYKGVLVKGQDALLQVQSLFSSLRQGDYATVAFQLAEWDDVNKTQQAVQNMKAENAKGSGPELEEVLAVVVKVARVALTLAVMV